MRCRFLPVTAAFLLVVGTAAGAPAHTHYRWTDASGVVHFSDTIPASALAGGYDIVNNEGQVVRHIAPVPTAAERKASAAAAAQAAATRRQARRQKVKDAQLLVNYPTAEALQTSQQARREQIQAEIKILQTNLHSQERTLTALLGDASDREHAHKPVPRSLEKRIAAQRKTVSHERSMLDSRRASLASVKAQFAAQLEHYRKLRAKHAAESDPQH